MLYAEAGIPRFWRIEDNDGSPVVHVHELEPVRSCHVVTGIHHGRVEVEQPYLIDIDLSEVQDRV